MMRRLSFVALFLLLCFSCNAELSVEWLDPNTIVVTGYGDGGGVTNENQLGSCTNCLAISPAEMRLIKDGIIFLIDECSSNLLENIDHYISVIDEQISNRLGDIQTFRRFGNTTPTGNLGNPDRVAFTNYVFTFSNMQTDLDKLHLPAYWNASSISSLASYNNGIYDYAQYITSDLQSIQLDLNNFRSTAEYADNQLQIIKSVVSDITEESCTNCSSSSSSSCSGGDCPCKDQWDALLDYVKHIDEDQHKRFDQLGTISNNVFNIHDKFDSYAKLVSGVLYQDGTIVVDDAENSWTNVYRRGDSDLYYYDKSNILQRIELLLFGISFNLSTNWGDIAEHPQDKVDDINDAYDEIDTLVAAANDKLTQDVADLRGKFTAFFDALNFFGAGHLGEFSVLDPMTVFGAYTFEVDTQGFASSISPLQTISRTCFQILYWVSGGSFMLWFWLRFISFITSHVLAVIRFFNNLLT